MKKIMILVAFALLLSTNHAKAMNLEIDPYLGTDFSMAEYNFKHNQSRILATDFNALNLVAGLKTPHYIMFETFLQRSFVAEKRTETSKINTNHWAVGLDVLGYYPVYQDFDLIAGVGFGEYYMQKDVLNGKDKTDSGHGFRYTIGGEYFVDENWGIRATYRYINFTEYEANRANEYSIGFRYHFN